MSFLMRKGYDVLSKIVSTEEFVEDAKLASLIAPGAKKRSGKGYAKEMARISKLFESNGEPDIEFWSVELLEAIDKAAVEAFAETRRMMVTDDETYLNALSDYMRQVIELVRKHRGGHKLTDRVVARIRWILTVHPDRPSNECAPIPLMTETVFVLLNDTFRELQNALGEVSRRVS
jgi:hypothetical protein